MLVNKGILRNAGWYGFLTVLLVLSASSAKGQMAEYSSGNCWVHATAQKAQKMDFINASTGVLRINGTVIYTANFENNGTVDYDNSITLGACLSSFQGTSAQTLSGTGTSSFYKLQLSGTAFSLQQPVTVIHQLDLSSGIVAAQQTTPLTLMNPVKLAAGASCVNASSASFVDGFVQKTGNTAFAFPVGNGSYYRPISLAAPTVVTDAFAARYVLADPSVGGYSRTAKASGVGEVSNKEYWMLQRTSGSSLPQVTLSWDNATSATVPSDLSLLQVVRWDGSQWVNEGNVSTTGDASAGTITSNVTGYGVMSLAVKSATTGLTVKVYPHGLWNGTNLNQCMLPDGATPKFAGAADTVSIELHNASDYSVIEYRASGLFLGQDGVIFSSGKSSVDIPGTYTGSYYITVKTRNHIETTSATPVSFASGTVAWNFTTAAAQAYGSNQLKKGSVYVLFGGDIAGNGTKQDGFVDVSDFSPVRIKNNSFIKGYLKEDFTGDGIVDASDVVIIRTNVNKFTQAILP